MDDQTKPVAVANGSAPKPVNGNAKKAAESSSEESDSSEDEKPAVKVVKPATPTAKAVAAQKKADSSSSESDSSDEVNNLTANLTIISCSTTLLCRNHPSQQLLPLNLLPKPQQPSRKAVRKSLIAVMKR